MTHRSKSAQSGRTMLEIISVMAMIGVLTIGSIAFYRFVMNYQQSKALYNDFKVRSALNMEGKGRIFSTDMENKSTYDKEMTVAQNFPQYGFFKITAQGVEQAICKRLIKEEWPEHSRIYLDDKPFGSAITECPQKDVAFSVVYRSTRTRQELPPLCTPDSTCEGCTSCQNGECRAGCSSGNVCYDNACVVGSCTSQEDGTELCCPATPKYCPLNAQISGNQTSCACECPSHRTQSGGICGDCHFDSEFEPFIVPQFTQNTKAGYGTLQTDYYSINSADEDAWRAFDGDKTKHFLWVGNYSYVIWHLPQPVRVKSTTIWQNLIDPAKDRFPRIITLYGSNDKNNWTTLGTITNQTIPPEYVKLQTDASQQWTSLKWEFNDNFGGWYEQVGEIEMEAEILASSSNYTFDTNTFQCTKARTEKEGEPCHPSNAGRTACNQSEGILYKCTGGTLQVLYTCNASNPTNIESLQQPNICPEVGNECFINETQGICLGEEGNLQCCAGAINLETNTVSETCCNEAVYNTAFSGDYYVYSYLEDNMDVPSGNTTFSTYINGTPLDFGLCCFNAIDLVTGTTDERCGQATAEKMNQWTSSYLIYGMSNGEFCYGPTNLSYKEPTSTQQCCDFVKEDFQYMPDPPSVTWVETEWGYNFCCQGPFDASCPDCGMTEDCCKSAGGTMGSDWWSCCKGAEDLANPEYDSYTCCSDVGGEMRTVEDYFNYGYEWDMYDVCFNPTTNCPISQFACERFSDRYNCQWNNENQSCEPIL